MRSLNFIYQTPAIFILSLLLFSASMAFAVEGTVTLQGKVFEKGSRKVLEGVMITAQHQPGTLAVTDANGMFTLTVPSTDTYFLTAAALGYEKSKPREVRSDTTQTIIIFLEPGVSIPDVVVKAERNPENLSKTIIAGDELRMIAGSRGDPLIAITSLPGISADTGAPAIRGSGPGDNIYIVDFLPVGHIFHMGGLISTINGDLVDDFTVYKSAFGPELYVTDDVTGSAIDVHLREPNQDYMSGKLHISFLESDFLVEGPVADNQSFYFGARRSYFDAFLSEVDLSDDDITFVVPVYWDYQGKYLWKPNNANTVSIQLGGASDAFEFTIGEDSDYADTDPDLVGESKFDIVDHHHGIVWTNRTTNGTVNKFAVGRLDVTADYKLASIFDLIYDQEYYGLKEQTTMKVSESHEMTFGGGYVTSSADMSINANIPTCTEFDTDCSYKDAEKTEFHDQLNIDYANVFFKDRWQISERFTLTGGFRATHDDLTDSFIADPRASAEFSFDHDITVSSGWGRYHQTPEYKFISEKLGNPDLDKIESDHYVLGAVKKFKQGWSITTEGYYKTFNDLVTSDQELKYTNNGVGRAYGIDFLLRKELTDHLSGWLGVTLSKAERKDNAQGEYFDFAYDRPVDLKLVVNYKLSPRWTFGAKWVYHSGTVFTPVIGTNGYYDDGSVRPVYGELNSDRTPDYHSLDLRVERLFLYDTWKLFLYFEIMNAYFRENVESYDYNEDYSEREEVYGLPTIPFLGLRAEF